MRVSLFNTPVDILSREETIARAVTAMRTKTRCQHVALNVAKLVNARSDEELRRDVEESDIVGIDGMGVVYALRLMGHRVEERVAGVDLFADLMQVCAEQGFRPFLLGATPEVLTRTQAELRRRHPELILAGCHHGYFKPAEDEAIVEAIRDSKADCVFIAMPTPRKERFMRAFRDRMGAPFLMGVGGTFDIVSGHTKRAPAIWQKLGMEWLYRMLQEPRRMFWRYARTNAIFAAMLAGGLASRLAGRRAGDQARAA